MLREEESGNLCAFLHLPYKKRESTNRARSDPIEILHEFRVLTKQLPNTERDTHTVAVTAKQHLPQINIIRL
jgi:hypothetical protein